MEGLDTTILGTALPQIADSLHVTPPELSLAITSYLLSLAVFIPISGWIADRFGARRVYCAAIGLFTLGSALCGAAQSLEMLVAMRIVQGIGGAMMTPVGRLIVVRAFPKDQLITAMNYIAIPGMVGPMLGPLIGGLLTQYVSWHWIFFINIPIGIAGILLTLKFIDDIQPARPAPFDARGFVIVAIGLALGQLALENIGRDFISPAKQVGLVVGAAAMFWLYGRYVRTFPNPILDLSLFRIRTFAVSVLVGSVSRLGVGAIPFLLPLFFQIGFGYSPLHAGLLMIVITAGSFTMRLGMKHVLRALGLRNVLVGNAVLLGFMMAGLSLFHADGWQVLIVGFLWLLGVLRSIQLATLNALGYVDIASEAMSNGTSIFAVVQRLSMSASVAIAAGMLTVLTHGGPITLRDFTIVLVTLGMFEIVSAAGYLRLKPSDGAALIPR